MPHSVEMPAPVNGTIDAGVRDQVAQALDGGLKIGRGGHRVGSRKMLRSGMTQFKQA